MQNQDLPSRRQSAVTPAHQQPLQDPCHRRAREHHARDGDRHFSYAFILLFYESFAPRAGFAASVR